MCCRLCICAQNSDQQHSDFRLSRHSTGTSIRHGTAYQLPLSEVAIIVYIGYENLKCMKYIIASIYAKWHWCCIGEITCILFISTVNRLRIIRLDVFFSFFLLEDILILHLLTFRTIFKIRDRIDSFEIYCRTNRFLHMKNTPLFSRLYTR